MRNKKLSESARQLIVKEVNKLIANCPLPEARQNLINSFSTLLIACDSYKGFNYGEWLDGGHSQWMKDGQPLDNSKYLGDKTLIRFY